jgi:hypothetical protein
VRTFLRLILATTLIAGCDEPAPPEIYMAFFWPPVDFSLAQGAEGEVTVTVDRIPEYRGRVRVSARELPAGITWSVTATTQDGITTAQVKLRAAGTAVPGRYKIALVVSGDEVMDEVRYMWLHVLEAPDYVVSLAQPALTISRGGAAPVTVNLNRTNFTTPVTLSVSGVAGITASFASNPVTGASANGQVLVGGSVTPGSHTITVRAAAPPLADRTVQLPITVTADHLQLFTDTLVSARQGAVTSRTILLNKSDEAGNVTISAEGAPAGAAFSFVPGASREWTMSITVAPSAATGSYPVTLRARGEGVPDATAQLRLAITHSGVALAITPETLSVFQGSAAVATVTLQRSALDTTVAISFENVPAGFTVTPNPANVAGSSSAVTVAAAASLAAGPYTMTVVATPAGWGSPDATRKTLPIVVRLVPAGGGNVMVDWGTCTPPSWFAAQDGAGGWTRVLPVAGVFRFSVLSTRGGFVYRDTAGDLNVRYMTRDELAAVPISMCPPVTQTITVTGTAVPRSVTEEVTYGYGGSKATSTFGTPNFTMFGVRPGVHDFTAFALQSATGPRGLIWRDMEFTDGGGVGLVDLGGPESFGAKSGTLSVLGAQTGESVSLTVNYLTTNACTVSELYSGSSGFSSATMYGVPDTYGRPTDYHMVTVRAGTSTRTRTATASFGRLESRSIALGQAAVATAGTAPENGYRRLNVTVSTFSSSSYDKSAELRYQGSGPAMIVRATMGYLAPTSFFALQAPDLNGADGFLPAFAPSQSGPVAWTMTLDGGGNGSMCSTSYVRLTSRHQGTF